MRAFATTVGACVALLGATNVAFAQDPATAQRLFAEGRALLEKGDVEPACARLEESRTLDPSAVGTLLNLAICNERRGRLASAWLQLNEVVSVSRATRPDRVTLAEERIRAIEPRLSKLAVKVPPDAQVPGLVVAVDGKARPASSFGTPIAIDGGEHIVTASAEGHATYTTTVTAPPERGAVEVTIPKLERMAIEPVQPPKPEPVPASPPPQTPEAASNATVGWVVAAGGIAVLAVGAGFGISVLAQADEAENDTSKYNSLDTQAVIANITLPVGAVLTGLGTYLVLSSKPGAAPAQSARPGFKPGKPTLRAGAHDVRVGWEASF